MARLATRAAAFAGRWYPSAASELTAVVDSCLAAASPTRGTIHGIVAPHAGLMYSGPIAGHSYASIAGHAFDVVVLVGPSHYVRFKGVALPAAGAFDSPLGALPVHDVLLEHLTTESLFRALPEVHAREHSLELQLPFLARVLPRVPILPLLMGEQDRATVDRLSRALSDTLAGHRALVIASSDLSHYHDRRTAARLDRVVLDRLAVYDAEGLMSTLERQPDHACGGGPVVVAMRTTAALGAIEGRVLQYGDSGDVSGDLDEVVGYVSAAFGRFDDVRTS